MKQILLYKVIAVAILLCILIGFGILYVDYAYKYIALSFLVLAIILTVYVINAWFNKPPT